MVTALLLAAALSSAALCPTALAADPPLSDPSRLSVGLPAEMNLVGLSWGLRPELLWRPLSPDGALHLRGSVGAAAGPELTLLPVSAGVRGVLFPRRAVRPGLGWGLVMQTFLPRLHEPVLRLDQYLELTLDVRVADGWRVGTQLSPELGLSPGFGLGMSARLGVQKDLPW